MAINKIIYGSKVLIDLTDDTVNKDNLLKGCLAHGSDGNIVKGGLFADYPETVYIPENLQDSTGNDVLDSSGYNIQGRTAYQKI